jgi:hypothetical protein
MADKTHDEFIEMWANFVRTHPRSEWKPQHTAFINSQIELANAFYKRLAKVPGGKEKIRNLRGRCVK